MSQTAYHILRKEQKQMLEAYGHLLPIAVATIEEVEGGSVRCMMAELFLEKKIISGCHYDNFFFFMYHSANGLV